MQSKENLIEEVKIQLQNLTNSPLYQYRIENNYTPVIGNGSLDATIMIVGEAPGSKEAKTGKPFGGASGKFLDIMLDSIDLLREDIYITNLVKDRPQENRDPTEIEISLYSPLLNKEIEIIKPRVIVCLGRIPMKYILNITGLSSEFSTIGNLHGKTFKSKSDEGYLSDIDIVCLYHPAAALYRGSMREVLLKDFQVLKKYI